VSIIIYLLINLVIDDLCSVLASSTKCKVILNATLDCSNLQLTSIPNDIPKSILALNMSFNEIERLDETSIFEASNNNLSTLDLSHNQITTVSRDFFKNLSNLKTLLLSDNRLSEFDSKTFSDLMKLERLDLSSNSISIDKAFIEHDNLLELNLDKCNLEEIPAESFEELKNLETLTLSDNPFNSDFDTSAFDNLSTLKKLKLPDISQSATLELCNKLVAIDIIEFASVNISCFVLAAEDDAKFEDGIINNDLTVDPPVQLPVKPVPPTQSSTTSTTTRSTTTSIAESSLPDSNTIKINDHSANVTTSTPAGGDDDDDGVNSGSVVDVDNETIKFMLVGESLRIIYLFTQKNSEGALNYERS
jgi:Leucine-rich repeat (LRR) protein